MSMLKLLVILMLLFPLIFASLYSRFRHFEEIKPFNINIRQKRDTRNPHISIKLVHFFALGKTFNLKLFPDNSILSDDFEVQLIDADGQATTTATRTDGLYSGHEKNFPRNKVNAAHHDGEWYFYIQTSKDIFIIEPISCLDPQKPGKMLIAYRSRDVLTNTSAESKSNVPICRASADLFNVDRSVKNKNIRKSDINQIRKTNPVRYKPTARRDKFENHERDKFENRETGSKPRQRRASKDPADTCDISVMVDYRTYAYAGKKSPDAIVKWVSQLFSAADDILRNSGLSLNGVTFGVRVRRIFIHKQFTKVRAGESHYNMEHNPGGGWWDDTQTLSDFMMYDWHAETCLNHLLTGRKFDTTLGLATIGKPNWWDPNGICSYNEYADESRNSGMTAVIDKNDDPYPIHMHIHHLAHELAHNFGALHDLDNEECAPPTKKGGKYLMWEEAPTQLGPNARLLSPCSITEILPVLKVKAHECFLTKKILKRICGDGIVTPEEDCDFGIFNGTTKDSCCTSRCRLRTGAVCSPQHHPCCSQNCQVAPSTKTCIQDLANDCEEISHCDGRDPFSCPRPSAKANGSPCGYHGTCWQGRCMSFCENLGRKSNPPRVLESCNCDESRTMMCMLCCWDPAGEKGCVPMGGVQSNGSRCLRGVCQNGFCKSTKEDIERSVIENRVSSGTTIFVFFCIGVLLAVAIIILTGTLLSSETKPQSASEDIAIEGTSQQEMTSISTFTPESSNI